MIQEVFRSEGVPLDLAYVPLVESAFKPNAVSRAKARGMWQFMRGTALENGLKHDWYIDERADPEKATRAAAKYLKTLYGMFGDWHLALASYNGGPGRVQRAMTRSGKDDFWELIDDDPLSSARDARLRAADPGGGHDRQESDAVRHDRRRARAVADRRACRRLDGGRSAACRRLGRRAGADHSGYES